ncbi:MAG: accessory factor UbiK family protein [Gammaproteobacteria bacterium]|nr:accessory factor UbiK family protein [Gammaproteobacteria bacterium]
MIDNQTLDELASRISAALPDGIKLLQQDAEKNIRAVLESTLSKMNLVSREEFDIQTAVLERTREKLKQLETLITELEKRK